MHKASFFPKMAAQSIHRNGRFYLPYLLTCSLSVAMFYSMLFLGESSRDVMSTWASVSIILNFGAVIIGIFSTILLFYTNSFLMKQRRRELGLYNILGMEKRHIARVLFWETLISALISLLVGLAGGVLFSKLLLLLLMQLMRGAVPFGFHVSRLGVMGSIIVFAAIYFLNLLANLIRVGRTRPIELLRSGSVGEREPRTRWLMALLGLASLGTGYWIANTVETPLQAISNFFLAVLLVIIGTYFIFIAGSIAILKLLRRNRRYYYKARHFVAVSGMLHRMKRNAAGLASICILSTMVLVTVSSTLCLYLGSEQTLDKLYPSDITLMFYGENIGYHEEVQEELRQLAQEQGIEISSMQALRVVELPLAGGREELHQKDSAGEHTIGVLLLCADDYLQATGQELTLAPDEALVRDETSFGLAREFTLLGTPLQLQGTVTEDVLLPSLDLYYEDWLILAVPEQTLMELLQRSPLAPEMLDLRIGINFDASDAEILDFQAVMQQHFFGTGGHAAQYEAAMMDCRAEIAEEYYTLYGGFFFLGIFLGTLFLLATALIIYYKQISEGYEDAGRFEIMHKVGMSQQETRKSIHSQILTVFFLPLVAAGVHICAAFRMIVRMLRSFSLYDVQLFALSCLGCFVAFGVIYCLIYLATARAYYQIVKL